ncbi:MAG TPA: hypothetical protein VIG69_02645 [Candidatus Methylomirabilis sp.]
MGLGLAIGTDAVRACKTIPWWRGLLLRWRGAAALPSDLLAPSPRDENIASVARFRELVKEVFQRRRLLGRVRVGLPETSVRVRMLFTDELPEEPAGRRKYLLWMLADALDYTPERSRLAHMVLPSPLPGGRHAVVCAVTGEKVMEQYERALAESGIRYSGITPSSIPLFNLFHDHLPASPGSPTLLLAATETATTAIMTLDRCPIFWRTHRAGRAGPKAPAAPGGPFGAAPAAWNWRGALLGDAADAIVYVEERLGVPAPARIVVTGPPAQEPGLGAWLEAHLKIPVDVLDAGRLVRPFPLAPPDEAWDHWEVALGAAAHRPVPLGAGPQATGSDPAQREVALVEGPATAPLDPAEGGVARRLSAPPRALAEAPGRAAGVSHVPGSAVVGNKRSKVYHVPGGRFYGRMATTSKNKVSFGSEADAERAGYRRSKR